MLIPAMHYRWNHDNFPYIYEEFGKVVSAYLPKFIRRIAGKKFGAMFNGFVPMLGVSEKSIPAIESWYENQVLPLLDAHFAKHDYLLGSRPCRGDFGLFGPLYAHLYLDPAPGKIMRDRAPNLVRWIERMNKDDAELGQWCVQDRIPPTLMPILSNILEEFWPVLEDTVQFNQRWIETHPDEKTLPRSTGKHEVTLNGVSETRIVRSFSQWKMQRALSLYNELSKEQKDSVDILLHELNAHENFQFAISHPVEIKNNKLCVKQP